MSKQPKPDTESQAEAQRILDRVAEQSETVGTSSMRRVSERLTDHLSADDADKERWTEVWGTRIGRGLGILFFFWLLAYMVWTYVLNG